MQNFSDKPKELQCKCFITKLGNFYTFRFEWSDGDNWCPDELKTGSVHRKTDIILALNNLFYTTELTKCTIKVKGDLDFLNTKDEKEMKKQIREMQRNSTVREAKHISDFFKKNITITLKP